MALAVGGAPEWAVLIVLTGTLAYVAIEDWRHYRIANGVVLGLAVLFLAWCLVRADLSLLLWHGVFAAAIGAVLIGLYAANMLGGGDVKLLAVAFLWIGAAGATLFSLLLSVFAAVYVLGARLRIFPSRQIGPRRQIPFGPAICAAWAVALLATVR